MSNQVAGNLNALSAITRAAVLYLVRTLFKKSIPLNDGSLDPMRVVSPEGSWFKPSATVAVAGGEH